MIEEILKKQGLVLLHYELTTLLGNYLGELV